MRENYGKRLRTVRIDLDLAKAFASALNELKQALELPGSPDLAMLSGLPDLIRVEEQKEDLEAAWVAIAEGVETALSRLVAMREREGARLTSDLEQRVRRLAERANEIERRAPLVVQEYAARLARRIEEMIGTAPIDEGRLAAEVAIFADRSDIAEETTRFRSHLAQMQQMLTGSGPAGRTLEFLVQELGREANTIGSKANDVEISRAVIAVKGDLESLREQIQNLE